MLVRVLRDRNFPAWPNSAWAPEGAPHVVDVEVTDALTYDWSTDAYFVGYLSEQPRRLKKESVGQCAITMHWLILEVDYPKPARIDGRAPDDWWQREKLKIELLQIFHPSVVGYRTRGGYRLIGAIDPFPIASDEDGRAWSQLVVLAGAYLVEAFGIKVDPACRDWTRLQGAPSTLRVREGEPQRQQLEMVGDEVGAWRLDDLNLAEAERAARALAVADDEWRKAVKVLDEEKALVKTAPAKLVKGVDHDVLVGGLAARVARVPVGGGRHDLYLALSGTLLSRGVAPDVIEEIVEGVSRGAGVDDEAATEDRIKGARSTAARHEAGEPYAQIGELQRSYPEVAAAVDLLLPDAGRKLARALREQAQSADGGADEEDKRPLIRLDCEQHRGADEVIAAFRENEVLYQRGNRLAEILPSGAFVEEDADEAEVRRQEGAPFVRDVPPARLQELITTAARLEKYDGRAEDWVRCAPPAWLTAAIHARGSWIGLHQLRGVADSPVFLNDGRVPTTPGYDRRSGLWITNGVKIEVPTSPTVDDAAAARVEIMKLVEEFSFVNDSHRAGWFCSLLTLISRFAYEGCVPLVFVEASTAGSGKSLLIDLASMIAFGRAASRSSYSPDDEEMRKKITSAVRAGDRLVLFDNVENGGMLKSAALDRALTGTVWEDRLLGTNESFRAPLNTTWFVSGNNLGIGGDLGRRTMHVRLVPEVEQPDRVSGFQIPDLLAHARRHRDRLISCAMTVLRAFHDAGRPDMGLTAWGSFEAWSKLPRAATVWCGMQDPGEARTGLTSQSDTSKQAAFMLTEAVFELTSTTGVRHGTRHGFTPKDLLNISQDPMRGAKLKDALEELCNASNGGKLTPKMVGWALRRLRGRIFNGKSLDSAEDPKIGSIWSVHERKK